MTPLEFDLHGLSTKKARQTFFGLMECCVKLSINGEIVQYPKTINLITGHGVIRDEITRLLDDYKITWHYSGPNRGCIVAYLGE
jgi:DNA-nicking Smr family endonuclease